MVMRPIRTEEERQAALREIAMLPDAPEGTPEGDRRSLLSDLVYAYETRKVQRELPEPESAIRARLAEQGDVPRAAIFEMIERCRREQNGLWGGPRHDDSHSTHDWVAFIVKHLGKTVLWPFDMEAYRRQMTRVAALAVAALEASYRWEFRSTHVPKDAA